MKIKIVGSFTPSLASSHTLLLDSSQNLSYVSPFNSHLLSKYSEIARKSLIHHSSHASSNISSLCEKLFINIPLPLHFLLPSFQLSFDNPLTQYAILLYCLKLYSEDFPVASEVTVVTSNIACICYLRHNYSVRLSLFLFIHPIHCLIHRLRLWLSSSVRIFKYIYLSFSLRPISPRVSSIVFISPSIFSTSDDVTYSPYWDTFISSTFDSSDISHLFLFKTSSFTRAQVQRRLLHSSPPASLLENNINLRVLITSLRQYIGIVYHILIDNSFLKNLPRNQPISIFQMQDQNYCLSGILLHIIQFNAYIHYFTFFKSPPLVFYLLEQRPSEFIVRSALSFVFNFDNSIGFLHSTVPYWNLRYINYCSSYSLPQYPRKCILSSSKYLSYLSSYGYPEKELFAPYPFRFLSRDLCFKPKFLYGRDSNCFLVLLDFDPIENLYIKSLFAELSNAHNSLKFFFKPHPASSSGFDLPLNINAQLLSPSSDINFLQFPLKGALCANSTSAVLEILHSRIPCAVHHCVNRLNLSPLYYFTDFSNYITNTSELELFLSNLTADVSASKLIYTDHQPEPLSLNTLLS